MHDEYFLLGPAILAKEVYREVGFVDLAYLTGNESVLESTVL